MASSEDTEITLGTGKLLVMFFGLVGVCALFFALGYSLGRKSEPSLASMSAPATPQTSSNTSKSSGAASNPAPPMTFYKAVEQKDASAELTPPAESKDATALAATNSTATNSTATNAPALAPAASPTDSAALPTSGYFVQVAAVSKQDDAQALVDALKKKEYPAFVAAQLATDKLFRVQLGPFPEVKEAEAMRTRLIGDGYSPILKK